ncbi:pyrroloquinoline quinone precursor peptide PqqA [Methylocella sp.]
MEGNFSPAFATQEVTMAWNTPVATEVCVGMEVTSYASAEI